MSAQAASSRKRLTFVDPAEFTPKFAWKKSARSKDVEHVFCEGVDLVAAAESFGTPAYVSVSYTHLTLPTILRV